MKTGLDGFYEDAASLFVEAYDAQHQDDPPQIAQDVAFYEHLAREAGGEVLELACGTGRIAIPLAEAGHSVTGADLAEGMLSVARQKAARLPAAVQKRLTLIRQDMRELALDRRFGLAIVAFRSFQHLLTPEDQRKALAATSRNLQPDGRLALHLFDPRLDLLIDDPARPLERFRVPSRDGRHYMSELLRTRFDHLAQTRHDLWRYCELGPDGEILREDTREMVLRWTYRWELRHLLELSGFEVEAEFSDFRGSPPAYGQELIVVARARPPGPR